MGGIAGAVEGRDMMAIGVVEVDDASGVQHPQEFHTRGADEGGTEVGFVFAHCFADEEDGGLSAH